ncbi:fumarylacetoacetate (FAA) hydrolase family protein [Thalassospira sp. MBR-102]|jgi:fumarylacetoacetate (FAA) hydrolase family protein|uniref:Fumarylacetoacetate hydrolase n=1 Tax=Thalassospira xiamenensis TaxID=220697 RepID=A0ABR5Y4Q1_9PROT|nr:MULTISPECIES: fumarylacetoacetate hydrolase family protein [Thalassospira]MAL28855.1 fumarylacetoacetate hydrolase [Thalassospira sp.]MBR9781202.1 fumarylacetoacetate hydrolase family protein [Rhodospirillales bacterium]KZD05904.1 fumarylacetoacetate hydrolase [Thalassospira xiamenensis]KZD07427.1 fumarylacetoacetate hydrolase [Thalassospira xiamenensis]MBL4839551.1 fumarylacetoacetate hydrolase family protein [Thalassospira sp.]|tara:strand:- start:2280 stop:3461 length:1182 start_codon:yes stop_codon:yes gene_type:complete
MTIDFPNTASDILPDDHGNAILVGRVWDPRVSGPTPVVVDQGNLRDISKLAPTISQLLERDDLVSQLRNPSGFPLVGTLDDVAAASKPGAGSQTLHLLSPNDLQAIKASGVTFVASLLERVIEEQARGDASKADLIRTEITGIIGDDLSQIEPGSKKAADIKEVLIAKGAWSQYLEVGIGPDAEIFTKSPPMSAVGHGAHVGLHPISNWNNPEPEVVLAVSSKGKIVGATLGNDVNLRDVEGRSALLLGKAKDNNGSCAIGPFIRIFDGNFTLETVKQADLKMAVDGQDGYHLDAGSSMSQISRSPESLAAQAYGKHHQYPDGFMLFLGTMFAPTDDRGGKGKGFTHEMGDLVTISTPCLGKLCNQVERSDTIAPWTFGITALMTNLAARGLL